MLARQAQTAVGVLRCPSARIIGRSQVRYASSSSTSSSASTSSAGKYATPAAALTAMIALGAIGYSSQSAGKVEAAKRKSYVERMRLEEKRRAEAESSAGGKEDVASQATSDLEEEVSHQSAFDPETNTINWDCPCLGGMAQGPCGEEFKKAFSCFVFSEQEPKGIECVENFKEMQACFRKYPEHYKDELEDEEESAEGPDVVPNGQNEPSSPVQGEDADEDEGVREWRREMSKE